MRKIYVVTDLNSGHPIGAWLKMSAIPVEYHDSEFYAIDKVFFREE